MEKHFKYNAISVGQVFRSRKCGNYIVTYVKSSTDVGVKFLETGFSKENNAAKEVLSGNIKDPYFPLLYGVGYFGIGEFNSKDKPYKVWEGILARCFPLDKTKFPSYKNCSVCEEWLNYQVFAKWYFENAPIDMGKVNVDKDLLVPNNKIYSPETCCIIPQEINNFMVGREPREDFPIGVGKHGNKFISQGNSFGKHWQGKSRNTVEEAFSDYVEEKERFAKHLANKWKNVLPDNVIRALLNFSVTERYELKLESKEQHFSTHTVEF